MKKDSQRNTTALKDYEAITNTWYLSAVTKGEYPDAALRKIGSNLHGNWLGDMDVINEPINFIGINYYTTVMLEAGGKDFPFTKTVDRNLPKTDMGWEVCLLYTSPSPRDATLSRMPSSA